MSPAINDGGSAFPIRAVFFPDGRIYEEGARGMTLRDYFAAKALQGQLAYSIEAASTYQGDHAEVAKQAYKYADAMLAERAKGGAA